MQTVTEGFHVGKVVNGTLILHPASHVNRGPWVLLLFTVQTRKPVPSSEHVHPGSQSNVAPEPKALSLTAPLCSFSDALCTALHKARDSNYVINQLTILQPSTHVCRMYACMYACMHAQCWELNLVFSCVCPHHMPLFAWFHKHTELF